MKLTNLLLALARSSAQRAIKKRTKLCQSITRKRDRLSKEYCYTNVELDKLYAITDSIDNPKPL